MSSHLGICAAKTARSTSRTLSGAQKSDDVIEVSLCLPANTSVDSLFKQPSQNADVDGVEEESEDVDAPKAQPGKVGHQGRVNAQACSSNVSMKSN